MINLEIKVDAQNLEEIKSKALAINALYKGVLMQKDTYFIVGKRRLKLREQGNINYFVYYLRGDTKESKLSKYYILNISNLFVKLIKKIFTVFFGIKTVVNKKRKLFVYKNTRIHLDEVENLGKYVELETVFGKDLESSQFQDEHKFVIEKLGLDKLEKISKSYSDLILINIDTYNDLL